jgi:hypothetical protein
MEGAIPMKNSTTRFEQVPITHARRIAEEEVRLSSTHLSQCVICRTPVELIDCKTDESGAPVHESCYLAKVARRGTLAR